MSYDAAVWSELAVEPAEACQRFARFMNPFRSVEFISKRTGQPYTVARLIGHNAATFDGPRLQRLFKSHNMFLGADPRIRCTCQAAMFWFDTHGIQPPSFKLSDLCRWFGLPVDENTHDALADVRMTIQLAQRLRDASVPEQVAA
jgi:DNA polymerase III epsilon subunit-like protein